MNIAEHVSGCTSSMGTDLLGKRGLRAQLSSRQIIHQLRAADSQPNRAAERRETGQQIKALFNGMRSGAVIRLHVLEQCCKLLQQTEAPGETSATAGGTNPALDCAARKYCSEKQGPSPLTAEDFCHHRRTAGDQDELQAERCSRRCLPSSSAGCCVSPAVG